jgi:hypothetical protein
VYYDNSLSDFDSYKQIEEADITLRQFFGPGVIVANEKQLVGEENIVDNLYKEDKIKYQVINYPLIRFFKRDLNWEIKHYNQIIDNISNTEYLEAFTGKAEIEIFIQELEIAYNNNEKTKEEYEEENAKLQKELKLYKDKLQKIEEKI